MITDPSLRLLTTGCRRPRPHSVDAHGVAWARHRIQVCATVRTLLRGLHGCACPLRASPLHRFTYIEGGRRETGQGWASTVSSGMTTNGRTRQVVGVACDFPSVRILHLADVHLDRPFVGVPLDAARRRRYELRATFERCLQLARSRAVDLVTTGGDLWEAEHVTADTRAWVAAKVEALEVPRRARRRAANHPRHRGPRPRRARRAGRCRRRPHRSPRSTAARPVERR